MLEFENLEFGRIYSRMKRHEEYFYIFFKINDKIEFVHYRKEMYIFNSSINKDDFDGYELHDLHYSESEENKRIAIEIILNNFLRSRSK